MVPRFETINEKRLLGKRMTMTFSDNKTGDLWRSFITRRKEILNNIRTELWEDYAFYSQFNKLTK
jgi:AraC family transcriptional regulator